MKPLFPALVSVFLLSLNSAGVLASPDNPTCGSWQPAASCNYSVYSRPSSYPISYLVVHKAEGTGASAASWFQNCSAGASAHYSYDRTTGYCYQSVREKDVAWHAGNWSTNCRSVGIEHGGYTASNDTAAACYDASGKETRSCIQYYSVTWDRSHIIGHKEVPGATHTDPGIYWNWTYYMQACRPGGSPSGTLRIGVLTTGGNLNAKDGFYGSWYGQIGGASKFDVDGNRIGALANGVLYVKEGLQGAWTTQIGSAADFQLCGDRIGVLLQNGTLTCKDGLYGSWYNQLGGVTKFHLNGNRIAVIAGGVLYVKEGLQGGWTTQTGSDITALQLCGDRIAALNQAGTLLCKDGLYGTWYSQMGGVTKFSIDGNRIAVISGGVLYVKDGLQGAWTTQTGSDIVALQVSGDRIGAITLAGTLLCKDGLYGSWYSQIGNVSAFQLKGNRIGALCAGTLTVKEGLQGGWVNQTDNLTASFKLTEY